MIKVLIAEDIPWANKGEVAIYKGILKSLKPFGVSVKLALFSHYAIQDQKGYGEEVKVIDIETARGLLGPLRPIKYPLMSLLKKVFHFTPSTVFTPIEFGQWNALAETDIVIVGHDNCRIEMSFEALCIVVASRLLRKTVVFYSGSFGPFKGYFRKLIARLAFNYSHLITCREPMSFENVQNLKLRKTAHLTGDLAFLLDTTDFDWRKLLKINTVPGKPLFGINANRLITRYCFPDIQNEKKKYESFVAVMARVIDRLTAKYEADIVLIPHVYGYPQNNDDRQILQEIKSKVKNSQRVFLIESELLPEELKGIIAGLDLFLGARTHSLIAALSSGVPSVALTTSDRQHNKTNGILSDLVNDTDSLYNVYNLTEDSLMVKLDDTWNRRKMIRTLLLERSKWMWEKAASNGVLLKEVYENRCSKRKVCSS
jgi:polysaccharide pyruvyl transferase WcaK-like protein